MNPLSETGIHSIPTIAKQRLSHRRHGGDSAPARPPQQRVIRRGNDFTMVIKTHNGIEVNSNNAALFERSHQPAKLPARLGMKAQDWRAVIQTPEQIITPPPSRTSSAGSSAGFQKLNGSAPAPVVQSRHQRATGKTGTDHNKINILARHRD